MEQPQRKIGEQFQLFAILLVLYALTALVFYLAIFKEFKSIDSFSTIRLIMLLLFTPILVKYIVQLVIAPWYPLVEGLRTKTRPAEYTPSVSVLIPAWNEEVGISNTLQSILDTQYAQLEIVVINDGSTDNTDQIIKQFIENNPTSSIIYEQVENGGKARALNKAIAKASGEIIITIDADSVMHPDAIKNLVKHFADPKVASVAGNVAIGNRAKPLGLLQQLEYLYGFYFKRADSLMNAIYIVGGAAAAYRKDILISIGGFDETIITEDIELSTRLQDRGYVIRHAADAIVFTEGPLDFKSLCKQRLRWKFGRLVTFSRYRHLFFSTEKHHNKYLSFLVLPVALFAEILLFFEGIMLTIFYTYTIYTHDFIPLAVVIVLLTTIISIQILSDPNMRHHLNLLVVAPIAWILFYIMDVVEYQALVKSMWILHKKKKLTWQRWSRTGVFDALAKK